MVGACEAVAYFRMSLPSHPTRWHAFAACSCLQNRPARQAFLYAHTASDAQVE